MENHVAIPPEEWAPIHYFGNSERLRNQFYDLMYYHRRVWEYRHVDFDFLTDHNFPIERWIRHQGWWDLFEERLPIYEFLVQTFYNNYSDFSAVVKETTIVFGETAQESSEALGAILNTPTIDDEIPEDVTLADVFNFLLAPRNRKASKTTVTIKYVDMGEEFKVLRHVLSYIVLPKMGGRDAVTAVEAKIMYRIAKRMRVSLPKIILNHMSQASSSRANHVLPYGMWLTKVFIAYDVDITNEPSQTVPHQHSIGEKLLRKMHVTLQDVEARFSQEWEIRTKNRNNVNRIEGPQPGPSQPQDGVPQSPVQPQGAETQGQVFEGGRMLGTEGTIAETTPTATALQEMMSAIKQLSKNICHLGRRFDQFERHVHLRFDHIDQEMDSLRHQAYHPHTPPPSNASYRPHFDRAYSEGDHDPLVPHGTHISPIHQSEEIHSSHRSIPQQAPPETREDGT